jgi:hypothetical protein
MTRAISAANADALKALRLRARDFLWITARNRETGVLVSDGMWSDDYNTTAQVVSPDNGGVVERPFTGVGTLVAISDVPLVSNLTVQNVTVTLSQVHDHVATLVRDYDCKQARVEIFRGLYDPETRTMVDPAPPRFVGFVDTVEIKTPKEGDYGSVTLTCTSHTQEMTRSNPDTRSDASQRLRNVNDEFYQDTAVVGEWEHFWGRASGPVSTTGVAGMTLAEIVKKTVGK